MGGGGGRRFIVSVVSANFLTKTGGFDMMQQVAIIYRISFDSRKTQYHRLRQSLMGTRKHNTVSCLSVSKALLYQVATDGDFFKEHGLWLSN